jgi:Zn-dependent alcohol dehydrogenase
MIAAVAVLGFVALVVFLVPHTILAIESSAYAVTPADRVVVMYFHRTQRCPTCLKMGGYTEEAITAGFAQEIKKGTVEFHYIDFQDKKNEALTTGYQVGGPTLIVAHVIDNKVKDRKNLTDIWTKVRDKPAFIAYVQSNVKNYLK